MDLKKRCLAGTTQSNHHSNCEAIPVVLLLFDILKSMLTIPHMSLASRLFAHCPPVGRSENSRPQCDNRVPLGILLWLHIARTFSRRMIRLTSYREELSHIVVMTDHPDGIPFHALVAVAILADWILSGICAGDRNNDADEQYH